MSGDGSQGLGNLIAAAREKRVRNLEKEVEEHQKLLTIAAEGMKDDTLLSSKQVGLMLGRHHKTIERWARKKGLPCVRVGRTLNFRLGDVRRWVAQRKEG